MKQKKILALESLRGFAALSVALLHFNTGSYFNNGFTNNAWLMVDFFFVLSGFVIAFNYIDRIYSLPELLTFQKKRFWRLYPLHLITLFLFAGIEIAKYIVEIKYGLVANNQAFSQNDFTSFLANIFLVQNLLITEPTFNGVSWSISSEFYTYTLFALLLLITRNNRVIISLVLSITILTSGILLFYYSMNEDNFTGPLRCLYSFSIGVLTLILYQLLKKMIQLPNSLISLILIISSVLAVINFGHKTIGYVVLTPFLFGLTILFLVLTKKNTAIHYYLSKNYLVYLGTISYGIYMIHQFVWWTIKQFLRFFFKFPVENLNGITSVVYDNFLISNLISFLGISLVIIFAHFSYILVEKRFYKKR